MICPYVSTGTHALRGGFNGGYLPLGTMAEMSDGRTLCFDCGYVLPLTPEPECGSVPSMTYEAQPLRPLTMERIARVLTVIREVTVEDPELAFTDLEIFWNDGPIGRIGYDTYSDYDDYAYFAQVVEV